MSRVKVQIINNITGQEEHNFVIEIDQSSDNYLRQMGETRKRLKNYDDLLMITDHDYVLSLISRPENCQVWVG